MRDWSDERRNGFTVEPKAFLCGWAVLLSIALFGGFALSAGPKRSFSAAFSLSPSRFPAFTHESFPLFFASVPLHSPLLRPSLPLSSPSLPSASKSQHPSRVSLPCAGADFELTSPFFTRSTQQLVCGLPKRKPALSTSSQ
ncbi:hypothetical protein GQ54DRAFT_94870 [Martensiomyces pterosporus]|nr:hypothetical protein GQ54DRAFT_94870 [Martensiomyces pterosporus]